MGGGWIMEGIWKISGKWCPEGLYLLYLRLIQKYIFEVNVFHNSASSKKYKFFLIFLSQFSTPSAISLQG